MHTPVQNQFLAPSDAPFSISDYSTAPPADAPGKKQCKEMLKDEVDSLADLQRILYADKRHSVLLVFQALDAAGKDSTIRAVLTGVNPAGCQVTSFKRPSARELNHDFLWRTTKYLPERGKIGVFNRSYYEEVLVVRVHPSILESQQLPPSLLSESIWKERFQSICAHEQHLARNGTLILKFWLHVSKEEQRERFLKRLQEPEKHWKFAEADMRERALWPSYMEACAEAVRETSKPWAPWYVIPADSKSFMRLTVAQIIVQSMRQLHLEYPRVDAERKGRFKEIEEILLAEKSSE